jgi:hypothetical protein
MSALIIENTFTSIPHLVRGWPMGRFLSLLTTQKWFSASKVAGMPPSLAILMLSGLRDSIIPSSEMAELWEVAKRRRPKKNTRWINFVLRRNIEESGTPPEKDVMETFRKGDHSAYHFSTMHPFL